MTTSQQEGARRHCEARSDEAIQSRVATPGLLRFARNDAPLLAIIALFLASPALAGPRKIDDCEAIKDANAYNLCLASFGPMRGQHGASYPGVASEGEKGGASRGASKSGSGHATASSYGRGFHTHGRIRMEFTPGRR
ncbi:hypothetical protein [Methylocystis sp. JR02]|uniref:hypothetical protein n=1 Tax=Methylocystis sp. JR02 TaxID=3046284 RepID=UPI0024BA064A|nr:hypothetical protein [Methylocystis sp. JR02]MDJ0448987.1 hypothetical protein [Methylocystis sp. JR02]